MNEIMFEARDYLNHLQRSNMIIRLAHFKGSECDGHGRALILSPNDRVAIMLEDCGDPSDTGVLAGNLVNYVLHPEAEPRIAGGPASVRA